MPACQTVPERGQAARDGAEPAPGFVSFALPEGDTGLDAAIEIFEAAEDLAEANRFSAGWTREVAELHSGWSAEPSHVTTGRIVVQRGI